MLMPRLVTLYRRRGFGRTQRVGAYRQAVDTIAELPVVSDLRIPKRRPSDTAQYCGAMGGIVGQPSFEDGGEVRLSHLEKSLI